MKTIFLIEKNGKEANSDFKNRLREEEPCLEEFCLPNSKSVVLVFGGNSDSSYNLQVRLVKSFISKNNLKKENIRLYHHLNRVTNDLLSQFDLSKEISKTLNDTLFNEIFNLLGGEEEATEELFDKYFDKNHFLTIS